MLLIDEKSIECGSNLVIKNLGQIYKYMPPLIIGTPQLSTLYFDLYRHANNRARSTIFSINQKPRRKQR
jgi:hypothetical protein